MNYTLFIFRRDLRLVDNTGLYYACSKFSKVVPIFIFTPEQVSSQNDFKSENAIQFMKASLQELDTEFQKNDANLHYFYGTNLSILNKIKKLVPVERIVFNMDYTPYALERDAEIESWGEKNQVEILKLEDYLLYPIDTLLKSNGEAYTIFTAFKNLGLQKKNQVRKVNSKKLKNLTSLKKELKSLLIEPDSIHNPTNQQILVTGGRSQGLQILQKIKDFKNYGQERNTPSIPSTRLSAYLKFGCISIREVFHTINKKLKQSTLIDQLLWREFYYYIAYYYPQVLKGKNYNSKYDKIKWSSSKSKFEKWCSGETGFPIVDAGMRELNQTGYMHNRLRLITSNFLNRMLGLDWRLGEKYFAQKLTDYDPAVNNGNWQWIASTGTDPKPYFQRLFNPKLQSQKFDPDCIYILKWIPELQEVEPKDIHLWSEKYQNYQDKKINYPQPIVNYIEARKKSIEMYRAVLKN